MQGTSLLRLPAVLQRRGKRKSSHYRDIQLGLFTKGVSIGVRARAWPDFEVDAVNAAVIAGQSEVEIRELVGRLEAARPSRLAYGIVPDLSKVETSSPLDTNPQGDKRVPKADTHTGRARSRTWAPQK